MKWNYTKDQRISLKTTIRTIPEPEPETRAFWSNPTQTRPEVKKPYSSRPGQNTVVSEAQRHIGIKERQDVEL